MRHDRHRNQMTDGFMCGSVVTCDITTLSRDHQTLTLEGRGKGVRSSLHPRISSTSAGWDFKPTRARAWARSAVRHHSPRSSSKVRQPWVGNEQGSADRKIRFLCCSCTMGQVHECSTKTLYDSLWHSLLYSPPQLLCSDEGSIHKWRYWFRHRTPAQVDAQVRTQVDAQVETQVDQRWYTSEAQVVALVETLSKSLWKPNPLIQNPVTFLEWLYKHDLIFFII